MTNWFIRQDGQSEDVGPLRPSELLQKVRDGVVVRETQVRKDNSAWFNAGDVGGLFEAAMRPTIELFCPHCKSEVSEPPTVCHRCGCEVQQALTRITENSIAPRPDDSITGQAGRSVKNWLQKKRIARDKTKGGEDAKPPS